MRSTRRIFKEGERVRVVPDPNDKPVIQNIPGWRWDAKEQEYWFPLSSAKIVATMLGYYQIDDSVADYLRRIDERAARNAKMFEEFNQEKHGQHYPSDLMEHQARVLHMLDNDDVDSYGIFMDTGTGKTRVALELIKIKRPFRTLLVGPLSLLKTVYPREVEQWAPDLDMRCLWTPSGNKSTNALEMALRGEGQVHTINYHMFTRISETLIKAQESNRPLYDCFIVDESSKMKDSSAKFTKAAIKFGDTCKFRFIMSGCPAPNSPLEYYSQLRLIDPEVLGKSYFAFRNRFFKSGWDGVNWTIDAQKLGQLMNEIRRCAVFIERKDCLDLDEPHHLVREVPMTTKQAQVYHEMKTALASDLGGGLAVVSKNALVKVMKLRQITSGFVIPTGKTDSNLDSDVVTAYEDLNKVLTDLKIKAFDKKDFAKSASAISAEQADPIELSKTKLAEFNSILDELGKNQMTVWMQFKEEFRAVMEILDARKIKYECLYGETDKTRVQEIDEGFINGKFQLLLCHPRSVMYGHTWVNCNYACFYSLSYSWEEVKQSRDRHQRIGQTAPVTYFYLLSTQPDGSASIDHVLFDAINNKKDIAEETTSYLKGEWDEA